MSAKHNCKHVDRSRSNYPNRPGVYSHGHLAEVEGSTGLRSRQERRVRATCSVGNDHDGHKCDGFPFPFASEVIEDAA